MPSFQVLVLGFLFVSFRPSQFRSHSCSTGASLLFRFRFFSGLSPFRPVSFVPFCSGSDYSAFCSSFPFLPVSASSVASSVLRFCFRFFGFPRSLPPGLPCVPSRFSVLGFLFVSFHPSRLRSHSCSTGASLLFRFLSSASFPGFSACLPVPFVPFGLLLTTQPSALSFPFFPFSPGGGSYGARFPLPFGLFPCRPSDSGTQLPAFPFSIRCLASQWLPQRLSLPIALPASSPLLSL